MVSSLGRNRAQTANDGIEFQVVQTTDLSVHDVEFIVSLVGELIIKEMVEAARLSERDADLRDGLSHE